ncbi:MAG: DsbA family protein [Candidatus Limivivens sp.]|nr:DsbA family protein [Candidatus Limivivens sp.]
MTTIKVFFDYVCPFCYLEFFALKEAISGKDVKLELIPHELRRPPVPKVDPMHDEMRLKRFDEVLAPEARKLGIPMELPWISPHPYTTDTFLGFLFCRDRGLEIAYTEKVFLAFYVEQKDIGEMDVLKEIAASLDLDPDAFEQEIRSRRQLPRLDALNSLSKDYEIKGIPVTFIGSQRLDGNHEPEVYSIVLESVQNQESESGDVQPEIPSAGAVPPLGMACGPDGNCG